MGGMASVVVAVVAGVVVVDGGKNGFELFPPSPFCADLLLPFKPPPFPPPPLLSFLLPVALLCVVDVDEDKG